MSNRYFEEYCIPEFKCTECGKPCKVVEDTFDYPGTHCTHGLGGTYRTGDYYSECCGTDYEED